MSLSYDEDHRHSSKSCENTKTLLSAEELDFEYDSGSIFSAEKTIDISEIITNCKPTDKGDGMEDGEIIDVSDCITREPCRFYQRGRCLYGKYCSFLHLNDKGLYNMFDSSPVVRYSPFRRKWVDCSRDEMVDTSWERTLKEAMCRVRQWDLARHRKTFGNINRKVLCGSKLYSQTYTCKSAMRKSLPQDIRNEIPKKKSAVSDHLSRHNFHSAWRDPWRRSPGRKILPSPPTSDSCSSKSHSLSSSPSKRSHSNRRRSSSTPSNHRSTSSSDSLSPSPKRKRSSHSKQQRRNSWIPKIRHRSTSSCHSSLSPSRKRRFRSRRCYRNRSSLVNKARHQSSHSTSLSSSLSPRSLKSVAKSTQKLYEREKNRVDTKVTSTRGDAKASSINKRFSKKLQISMGKVDVYPIDSLCRQRGSPGKEIAIKPNRKGTKSVLDSTSQIFPGKEISDKSNRKGTKSLLESTSHWTPKKIKSSSCSDMSISPLSSSVVETFELSKCRLKSISPASGLLKKLPRDMQESVCTKALSMKSSASSLDRSTFDGKRAKVRKKIDPLEKDLMKFNKNFISMKRCPDIERPLPKAIDDSNVGISKSKKVVKDENVKPPSRKEILLKRLEAINAAIARKTKNST